MRHWRSGRRGCPKVWVHPQRSAPQPGCLGSSGESQAESAHLASGKGRARLMGPGFPVEGCLLSLHTWAGILVPRRGKSL